MTKWKKILLWVAGVLAGLFIVLLLILQFLAPAILNSESIKSKIEALASEEIGADITFRRIDLSLFPRFIIVVHQFGLFAPGTAGGTVKTVRVYPKLSHLLVGKFHIARAVVEAPDFAIVVSEGPEAKKKKSPKKQKKETTFTEDMEATLGPIFGVLVPSPGMAVTIEQCKLDLTEGTKPLFAIRDMDVGIVFPPSGSANIPYQEILSARTSGHHRAFKNQEFMQTGMMVFPSVAQAAPADPSPWPFRVLIDLKNVDVRSKLLPGPITITGGTVEALHEKLSFTDLRLDSPGTSLTTSGSIGGYQTEIEAIDVAADGAMATRFTRWLIKLVGVAPEVNVRSALSLSKIRLTWDHKNFSFAGRVATEAGHRIDADIRRSPGEIIVKKLTLRDKESSAAFSLTLNKDIVDLAFTGNLTSGTMDKFIARKDFPNAWIKGDFHAHILLDQPLKSTAQGTLSGRNLLVPLDLRDPPIISRISLRADKNAINVLPTMLRWGKNHLSVNGNVNILKDRFQFDMDVSSEGINWGAIQKERGHEMDDEPAVQKGKKDGKETEKGWDLPFQGSVRFRAASFTYDRYTVRPFHADIILSRDGIRVAVPKAVVCNVAIHGSFSTQQNTAELEFALSAENQQVQPMIFCFLSQEARITGTASLNGRIAAKGELDVLTQNLRGSVAFAASNGRIDYAKGISRTLDYLNVTEVFRGKFKDLREEALVYNEITAKTRFAEGKFFLDELVFDGVTMDMAASGSIDLARQEIDAVVLVSPLKTGNVIVQALPIIRNIFGGTLVTVPLRLSGKLDDLQVTYHPIREIGAGLVNIMKRTIQAPYQLINPEKPDSGEEQMVE